MVCEDFENSNQIQIVAIRDFIACLFLFNILFTCKVHLKAGPYLNRKGRMIGFVAKSFLLFVPFYPLMTLISSFLFPFLIYLYLISLSSLSDCWFSFSPEPPLFFLLVSLGCIFLFSSLSLTSTCLYSLSDSVSSCQSLNFSRVN